MKNRTLKKCLLSILLILIATTVALAFTACGEEPTETVNVLYEEHENGIHITGYDGVLAEGTVLTIPSTINGKDVVAIDAEAFAERDDLKTVIIPATVVYIGEKAFYECENLEYVNIPYNLTAINAYTFYGCASLKSVDIPSAVSVIYENAFEGCTGITELTAPGWAIDRFELSALKSLNLRGDIEMTKGIFAECTALESITIPYVGHDINASADTYFGYIFGASNAGENASFVPSTLKKVVVTGGSSTSLAVIDDNAFYGCSSIETVMLPANLKTIGSNAFMNCSALTKINLPASISYIGASAFENTSIESVALPQSVSSVSARTFYACSNLKSVTLSSGVTAIGDDAFYGCIGLNELHVGSIEQWLSFSFESYEDSPLYYAGNLYFGRNAAENIVIPANVTKINDNAFYRCTNLKSVTLHDGITEIGDYAFAGCISLETVNKNGISGADILPSSLEKIGAAAFSNCKAISALTIPESVTEIGEYAFNLCTSLKTLTINADLASIPEGAFHGSYITDLVINGTVGNVNATAFEGCTRIKSAVVPMIVATSLPTTTLTNLRITDGTSVDVDAFKDASRLAVVYLPDSVTVIESGAFENCVSLRTVIFGAGSMLYAIEEGAFKNCAYLTDFTVGANVSEIESGAFEGCYRLAEVYNLSTLTLSRGTLANGGIAMYAYSIKGAGDATGYIEDANYLFYNDNGSYKLIGYFGKNTVITLPDYAPGTDKSYSIAPYAFANTAVNVITVPSTASSASANSFLGASALTEVNAPAWILEKIPAESRSTVKILSVTAGNSINSYTIEGFSALESLIIGSTVKNINAYDLAQLNSLASITVDSANEKYKDIDGHLYIYSTSGDTLVRACPATADYFSLPITTVEIGDYAFYNCDILTNLYIESGTVLKSIGDYAFFDADILSMLELPATVTSIGEAAFAGCNYLYDITIESANTRYAVVGGCLVDRSSKTVIYGIGQKETIQGANGKNTSIYSCYVPADGSVTSIANYAFYEQDMIQKIVIPAFVTFGEYTFRSLSSLETIIVSGNGEYSTPNNKILMHNATGTVILAAEGATIPTDAKYIAASAYAGNSKIGAITIPENILGIEAGAFDGCISLANVTTPAKFVSYFDGEVVTKLTVTSGILYASDLEGYSALESFKAGAALSAIEEGAFKNCVSLMTLEADSNNTAIKVTNGALIDVASRTLITAVNVAETYKNSVKYYFNVPADGSVTRIGEYAFANRENFVSISIPANVTYVASNAFYGITNEEGSLISIAIPAEFISLVPAEKITTLTVTGGTTLSKDALALYKSLKTLTLPSTLTEIEDGALNGHKNLVSVAMQGAGKYTVINGCVIDTTTGTLIKGIGNCSVPTNGSIKRIADGAFEGNTLVERIALTSSVEYVGANAFAGCTALKAIFITDKINVTDIIYSAGASTDVIIYNYSATQPTVTGNFWYLDGETVKIWW